MLIGGYPRQEIVAEVCEEVDKDIPYSKYCRSNMRRGGHSLHEIVAQVSEEVGIPYLKF